MERGVDRNGEDQVRGLAGDESKTRTIMVDSFEAANAAIILPTLNEEAGLSQTLEDIPFDRLAGAGWRVRPLVVDGGSTDRTLEVAAAWGIPVLHQKSRGKGEPSARRSIGSRRRRSSTPSCSMPTQRTRRFGSSGAGAAGRR